ncbi:hypothetical protein [Paenibacillus sp. SI8]|uniref:hypothetical protein n=1 Tax=unclassified Paenibacillus TaxID=185978 RepID=UPI0034652DDD
MQLAGLLRNKKLRIILIIAALFLLISTAYHLYLLLGPRQAHYPLALSQSLARERVGGIMLGQSIKSIMPPPTLRPDKVIYDYYDAGKGIIVVTPHGKDVIIRIILSANADPARTTARGIGINGSLDQITKLYGNSCYRRNEQGATILGFIDKTAMQTLEFWLFDDRVTMIRLDLADMS